MEDVRNLGNDFVKCFKRLCALNKNMAMVLTVHSEMSRK